MGPDLRWPVLLVATGVMSVELGLLEAAGLAFINTAIGVLVHQGGLRVLRLAWYRQASHRIS